MKKKLFLRKETVALLEGEQRGILGGDSIVVPVITRTCEATACSPCETMYMRSCVAPTDFTCQESKQQCIVISDKVDCPVLSNGCIKTEICIVTNGY